MAKKMDWYRLHTRMPKMPVYLISESADWQAVLKKAADEKLGFNSMGQPKTAEMFHTQKMLDETYIDETDEEGILDTDDKELAKYVLYNIKAFSGLPIQHEGNPDIYIPHYMKFFRSILDKSSPTDVLIELESEMRDKSSPKARVSALAKARELKQNK